MGPPAPARRRILPALIGLGLLCGGGRARADEAARYSLRAELGGEYDSNVHRTEVIDGMASPPITASPAARLVLGGDLSDAISDNQTISAAAMLAGKLFVAPAAAAEDLAVAQTSASWRLALGARTAIGLDGLYYEAFQRSSSDPALIFERRDFRSLTPVLRLVRRLADRTEIAAGAGYRWFVFKPDLDNSFRAPVASIDLRWGRETAGGNADWDATAGATFEPRFFEGNALVYACDPQPPAGSPPCLPYPSATAARRDNFLMGHVDVTRTGAVLLGAGYALHWNSSNSYGETVTRHFVTLRFAAELPFGLYLAARGELLFARYLHPIFVGQSASAGLSHLSVDDENHSSVRVDVSRSLTERLQLLLRYTFYANEIGASGASGHYRRQTALLSVSFTLDH